jgi:hypothetical protein
MYGCDCYAYGLLAAGHCDLVVEADLKPYDYMALVPIIEVRLRWRLERACRNLVEKHECRRIGALAGAACIVC